MGNYGKRLQGLKKDRHDRLHESEDPVPAFGLGEFGEASRRVKLDPPSPQSHSSFIALIAWG